MSDPIVSYLNTLKTKSKESGVEEDDKEFDYKEIIERSLVGFYIIQDNLFKFVNNRFCDIFGYEKNEVANKLSPEALVYPTYIELVNRNIRRRIIEKVQSFEYEFKGVKKDGTAIWVKVLGNLMEYENSLAILGTIVDITESKRIEEKLSLSEERLRLTLEATKIGIWDWDVETGEWYASPIYHTMLGYRSDFGDLDKDKWLDRIHPDDRETVKEKVRQVLGMKSGSYEYEARVLHFNGSYRWLHVVGYNISKDASGKIKRIVGIRQDISRQKRIEEELVRAKEKAEESEIFLKQSQRSAHIGSMKLDVFSGDIIFTETLGEIIGVDEHENTNNTNFFSFIHPDYIEKFKNNLKKVISSKKPLDYQYAIIRQSDNETRWVHCIGRIYCSGEEGALELLCTLQDITEKRQLEEDREEFYSELENKVELRTAELKKANEDLEAFTYSVSHDLRAPLRHINGFLPLLKKTIKTNGDKSTRYLRKIEDSVQNMSVMIDELLRFSHLGSAELNLTNFDVTSTINSIIEQYKPDYIGRCIAWNVKKLPLIKGDQSLLRIVFENLISNAIKYTSRKELAVIEIGEEATEKEDECCIYIKDNGVGFNMEFKNKLFGVFQRLHAKEDFEGVGIGLANVRQIITKHKGTISAKSDNKTGATFFINLPKP